MPRLARGVPSSGIEMIRNVYAFATNHDVMLEWVAVLYAVCDVLTYKLIIFIYIYIYIHMF